MLSAEADAEADAEPGQDRLHADTADPAVPTAAVRGQGEVTGERPALPAAVQGASQAADAAPLRPARPSVAVGGPPVSDHPAPGHGVRAPPSLSGN
ncbi:hypothetical protein [Streptomyces sp. TUS-ST3]|uniref:hypothetical protein n=1 Tax=Streptomyces sp. TUS-ST3 TaxID=3025591 RepID=UPI0024E0AA22|nr:hypothetical protein [Streptomyces sp. TUS-ST3]